MTPPPPPVRVPVITGLDLPADAAGGSVELLHDLYAGPDPLIGGQVFMLPAVGDQPSQPDRTAPGLTVVDVPGKSVQGPPFWRYVADLTAALTATIKPPGGAVAHLQHLAFGASPALIGAYPDLPRIALVHGTDLLFAQTHPTQLHVLHRVISAAAAIVVPTTAMADRLAELAPHLNPAHLVHIPWGVPDQLLDNPPSGSLGPPRQRGARGPDGELRLLYAGRLTPEKGAEQLVAACAALPGVRLSIAAPDHQYAALVDRLAGRVDLTMPRVQCLGWLPRPRLWETFTDHDLLVVPSTTLEAFGLVAVEAQACGLPVAYQPVPGLTDVLAGSGLPVDLADPAALATALNWLRTDPAALADLRAAGLANAAHYPLSRTAARLADLTQHVATRSPERPQLSK